MKYILKLLLSEHFQSNGNDPFSRRKAVVIKLMIGSLVVLGFVAFLASLLGHIIYYRHNSSFNGLFISFIFSVSTILLYIAVRKGLYFLGTVSILALLTVVTLVSIIFWSFELPNAAILTSLTIVVGGILLSDKQSRFFSILVLFIVLIVGFTEVAGFIHPYLGWSDHILEGGDLFGLLVLLFLITQVSWISNHEVAIAFRRAKEYELELAAERDSLESKVKQRTIEIEQMQLERSIQLQRFIEFGRLTSGIVHDLASPLTSASLSIRLLEEKEQTDLVKKARENITVIERYLSMARDQLRKESRAKSFSVNSAINEVLELISHRSSIANVRIVTHIAPTQLHGDMTRFQQLVSNLILNAIDSYALSDTMDRLVSVRVKQIKNGVLLTVSDQGVGIPNNELSRIFEPFFSTKASSHGTGIGLMLARQISQEVFSGSLNVSSSDELGTSFIARLYSSH